MSEAGYGLRKPLNVKLLNNTSENRKRIVVAIAAMWKKLGVNVEQFNVEETRQQDSLYGAFFVKEFQEAQPIFVPSFLCSI